jgi:hypothetical protein
MMFADDGLIARCSNNPVCSGYHHAKRARRGAGESTEDDQAQMYGRAGVELLRARLILLSSQSRLSGNGNDYEVVATVNTVVRWSSVFIRLGRFLTGRPNRLCAVKCRMKGSAGEPHSSQRDRTR